MKAVEVIDLLSSPEPTKGCPRGGRVTAGWLYISDETDGEDRLPTSIFQKPMTHSDHMSKSPYRNGNSISTRTLTSSTTSSMMVTSSTALKSYQTEGKVDAKAQEDYLFLSDDLDNTIDPSDPFRIVLEPAAKRRKVNPAPNILRHTYSTIQTGRRIARSFSDVAATPRNIPVSTTRVARLKRSKTTVLEDDPILFSSSPDFLRIAKDRKETLRRMRQQDLSGDDDDNNDPFHTYQQGRKAPAAAIGEPEDNPHTSSSDLDLPEVGAITSHSTTSLSTLGRAEPMKTIAAYEHEKKALQKRTDKARKAQERLELRETEKERKRAAKEAKLKEKEMAADLAKVNTLRIDKKVSTPAMIVDLPMDLDARLAGQVRRFLSPLEVVCEDWRSPIANVIKLRRKVDSIYNEESGLWEPVPVEIKSEKHVMCVMLAKEFVDLTMADEGRDLEAHVLRVKARFGGVSVIYLIESLTQWMRKNRNVKNRQFAEAMRSRMTQEAVASAMENEKKNQLEYVDEDMIEDALLRLQMVHGAHIHHTTSTVDTAQWIMIFTQHISTIPYRLQRMTLDTAFCMESGQVKTGLDASDTFIKMLQEVNRVTAPIAYGIAAEYPSVQKLVKGFEAEGKNLLQNLKKSANKDGALTDKEIGKKISSRLWGIFMGTDPMSTDV